MTLRQEEGGLLLHDGAGRSMSAVQVIHLGFPGAPLLTCDHKWAWKNHSSHEGAWGLDPQGMRVWVMPAGKPETR